MTLCQTGNLDVVNEGSHPFNDKEWLRKHFSYHMYFQARTHSRVNYNIRLTVLTSHDKIALEKTKSKGWCKKSEDLCIHALRNVGHLYYGNHSIHDFKKLKINIRHLFHEKFIEIYMTDSWITNISIFHKTQESLISQHKETRFKISVRTEWEYCIKLSLG